MAVTIEGATVYISANVIGADDWLAAEPEQQTRILNVAAREIGKRFGAADSGEAYTIPDEAVYEYAAALAVAFNDTNKLQAQGIAGFSVTGVGSFTFKQAAGSAPLAALIPQAAFDIIGKANGVKLGGRRARWMVL